MIRRPPSSTPFPYTPLSRSAEATPQLDPSYFPPVLACEAWRPLQAGILHNLYDRLGKKIELLAGQVTARNRSEEHTSELQSRQYLVCRLLLEKKTYNTPNFS